MAQNEIALMLSGYIVGVVFGTMVGVSLYRHLVEAGKLRPLRDTAGQK